MGLCKNCKHFGKKYYGTTECIRIPKMYAAESEDLAVTKHHDHRGRYIGGLLVRPNFGCVLFEKKVKR